MNSDFPRDSTAPTAKTTQVDPLLHIVGETELYVASAGWDQPIRLFALASSAELIAREPHLRNTFDPFALAAIEQGTDHFTAIEQEGISAAPDLETFLGHLTWGPDVIGALIAVERIILPPSAEQELPPDPDEALHHLARHPERQDVRLVVAVTRDGRQLCAIRQRNHDEKAAVAIGTDLAPGLTSALAATLSP
ncbi:MAG: PPA1309 family protein [Actinomycetota bacterium]